MHWTSENPRERLLALVLITAGILSRILPHPDNFSPVVAIALFSGAVLPRAMALTVPVLIMIVSDLVIGPHGLYWLTWSSFAVVAYFGRQLNAGSGALRVFSGALAGSVFFFVTSNLGVFLFEGLYPRTAEGLARCFTMALPFFRWSLAGDILYTGVMFGAFALARSRPPLAGRLR